MRSKVDKTLDRVMAAYVGVSPDPPDLPDIQRQSSQRRWRPALAAGFAFVIVLLAVGAVAVLVRSGPSNDIAAEVTNASPPLQTEPVALGDDHIWPEEPFEGTPVELALAFASDVLGWADAVATAEPGASPTALVSVLLRHSELPDLDLVVEPIGSSSWVLIEVGPQAAVELALFTEAWLAVADVPGADHADVTVRYENGDLQNLHADRSDLDQYRVGEGSLGDGVLVRTVLVRYRDVQGNVIAAAAAHFELAALGVEQVGTLIPLVVSCSEELAAFPCEALIDGDPNTVWQVPDGGINATVTIGAGGPYEINEIEFVNSADDETYRRNARIREVQILTDDLPTAIYGELADLQEPGRVVVNSASTGVLTIRIVSAYPGQSFGESAPFTELALAEIVITGRPGVTEPPTGEPLRTVAETINVDGEPQVAACPGPPAGFVGDESTTPPTASGAVSLPGGQATPVEALEAFLLSGDYSRFGRYEFIEMHHVDGSTVFGRPLWNSLREVRLEGSSFGLTSDEGVREVGLDERFVVLISVTEGPNGWSVDGWESSGC